MHTTLNELRAHNPCKDAWAKLLKHLGKTEPDDEPLPFTTIMESNGILDAIWCLRVRPDYNLKVMTFKLRCARRVESFDKSGEAKKCLDVVESFIKGIANTEDLGRAKRDAAYAVFATAASTAASASVTAAVASADADAAVAIAVAEAATYAAASVAVTEREYQRQIFLEIFSGD